VFFRSPDVRTALAYCGSMFGLGHATSGGELIRGVIYQPYYLISLLACAGVTWLAPQTWDFTRALPPWKLAWATAALWVAMMALFTQTYNPFIYFIF
jgi:alginate O-acetyltransferase complex protein AlgI